MGPDESSQPRASTPIIKHALDSLFFLYKPNMRNHLQISFFKLQTQSPTKVGMVSRAERVFGASMPYKLPPDHTIRARGLLYHYEGRF